MTSVMSARHESNDDQPEAQKVLGIVVDVTDLKAPLTALEETRRRLDKIQELAHIGHWDMDYVEDKVVLSQEACRIFGKPPGWATDWQGMIDLLPPEDRDRIVHLCHDAYARRAADLSYECRVSTGAECRDLVTYLRIEYSPNGTPCRGSGATQDITELRGYQHRIHTLAFSDALTGLPNRTLFNDRIEQAVAHTVRHGQLMGVMMLDLDRFKAINDTLGHAMGDRILCEAAERLKVCVRDSDTVARLGGDEFAIILPEIRHSAELDLIARKILDTLGQSFLVDGLELFVSASIGVTLCPLDSEDKFELLRYADSAMYHAKDKGRNNFQFYTKDLSARAQERMALEGWLRHAQEKGKLELHYQPQIDMVTGCVVSAEALLRWNHPERGLILPNRFIGIAEDTGLIVSIGEWVLRTACATVAEWNRHGKHNLRIAVNLSPRQFWMNDLFSTIHAILEETACAPHWLELEITENVLLDDSPEIQATLSRLLDMGISLAIDDFGTGYCALSYLNRFPIDVLKIDRSFVNDVVARPNSAELVKAIISMAHSLRLTLVAEGVETEEQAAFLNACGCHLAQGWLYGKPMPKDQFEALLPTA